MPKNRLPHHLVCKAPICQGDPNPDYKKEVVWRPGEDICQKSPYQQFQKEQVDINYWKKRGKFKDPEISFTADELEARSK